MPRRVAWCVLACGGLWFADPGRGQTSATELLVNVFRFSEATPGQRLMVSAGDMQRAVVSLSGSGVDPSLRARLETAIGETLADIDMLQARYQSTSPTFGFDARSILTEGAVLLQLARGVQAASGSPSEATLNRLRDELVQVTMDLVDALQRAGSSTVGFHVGQGSNMMALAVLYDWLHGEFTGMQRQLIAATMVDYSIVPTFNVMLAPTSHSDRKWYAKPGAVSNWTTICIGGGVFCALALRDDDYDGSFACWNGQGSKVTRTFREHFDTFLPAALGLCRGAFDGIEAMGGTWDEGPGYHHDMAFPLFSMVESLAVARRDPGLAQPQFLTDFANHARQAAKSHILTGIHHAGPLRSEFVYNDGNWSITDQAVCFLIAEYARQAGAPLWRAAAWRAKDRRTTAWRGLFLAWHALFDWSQPLAAERGMSGFDPSSIPRAVWFHQSRVEPGLGQSGSNEHVAIWRQSWTDPLSCAVMFKGGDKRIDRHDNLDTGTFLFDATGVRWTADLGPPEGYPSYSPHAGATTFYQPYPKRAMGQNTLVINPGRNDYLSRAVPKAWLDAVNPDQAVDDGMSDHWAPLEHIGTGDTAAKWTASVNLASAYARHGILTKAQGADDDPRRWFTFDRASGVLEIRDVIPFARDNNEVHWYLHLPGSGHKPVHQDGSRILLQVLRDGTTPVYLMVELGRCNAEVNGGFKYGRIDENLPSSQPLDLLWDYNNSAHQRSYLRKIALKLTTAGNRIDATVRLVPLPELTGMGEAAALRELGLLAGLETGACGWGFNGSLANAHGGSGLVWSDGAPEYGSGAAEGSGSLLLDGTGQHATSLLAINPGDVFSVAAWVKVAAGRGDIQTIVANAASGAASGFKFYVNNYNTSDGALVFETGNGSAMAKATTAAGAVPAGTWTHVAAVVDRLNGHVRLFVNGRLVTTKAAARTDFRTAGPVELGCMAAGGAPFWFGGELDDVRIVPWGMPANEVRALVLPGPTSRWTFHRNTGEVTGSGPGFQPDGGAALVSDTRRHGVMSLYLDGNNDSAGTVAPVELGNQFTLSQWVRVASGRSSMQTLWFSRPAGSATGTALHLHANTWQTTDRKLILVTSNGSASATVSSAAGAVPFGQWAHVAAVIDRVAGTAVLYVNAVQVASGAVRTDFSNNQPLFLGSMGGGSFTQNLRGHIDEVRVDRRVLNAAEIAMLAESPGQPPVIDSVALVPSMPAVGEPLGVTVLWSDPDAGDLPRRSLAWGEAGAATDWEEAAVTGQWSYATSGTRTIIVRVDDGTTMVSSPVDVTVVPAFTPLEVTAPPAWSGTSGESGPVIPFTVAGGRLPPELLTVQATCSDPLLLPDANMIFGGSGSNRTLTLSPVAWRGGAASLAIAVSDGVDSVTATVAVTVGNPGTGGKWITAGVASGVGWSTGDNWQSGQPPWTGPASVVDFLSGFTLQPGTLATVQDLANPFETSRLTLGGTGPPTGNGRVEIRGGAIRLIANGTAMPRVDLDASAGGGFQYLVECPLELGPPVLFGGSGDAGFEISGTISGGGPLTKGGSSVLVLSGANTHTGRTEVQGGVLSIHSEDCLGAGPATPIADQLRMSGGVLRTTSTMVIDDPGRGIQLAATGGRQGFQPAAGTILTLATPVTGGGGLSLSGEGTLLLGGGSPAAYSGETNLSAGKLRLASGLDDRLPVATVLVFSGSAEFDAGGNTQRVAGLDVLSGTGNSTVTALLGNGELRIDGAGNLDLGPVTSNTGPITNTGVVLDGSALAAFSILKSGNLTIQPKTYNQQGGTSRLVMGTVNTIVADKLFVGCMAGGSQHAGTLEIGSANTIRVDEWNIGRSARASGTVAFRAGIAGSPGVVIRSENGSGRVANVFLTEQWGGAGTSNATLDFTGGTVDALLGNVEVGRVTANNQTANGTLVVGPQGGTLDAVTVVLAVASATGNGTANGTLRQLGGTLRADSLVLGLNSGTGAAPVLRALYQLGGLAGAGSPVLAARAITAGTGKRHADSTLTLQWNHGTITHVDGGGDLEIGGHDATASGQLRIVLEATGEHVFHAAAGRAIRVAGTSVLSGTGGTLRKTGPGTLLLEGTHMHTGMTTIAGGTLAGSPTLPGPLTVSKEARVAPGASIGSMIAGDTVIEGTLEIELDPTRSPAIDQLHVDGTLDIRDATLSIVAGGTTPSGAYILASYESLAGTSFREVTGIPTGYRIDYEHDAGDGAKRIALVPDPFLEWLKGFGDATGGMTGEGDDPDHDGLGNLVEWALAGNPVAPGADGRVVLVEGGRMQVRFFRRRAALEWVEVVPEWCADLAGPWRTDFMDIEMTADGETQEWRVSLPTGPGDRFVRLRIGRTR